ncbi:MAG TPA: hypothetical protein VGB45_08770 [Abditibacterium sp.]|jgi:hypothetical protein
MGRSFHFRGACAGRFRLLPFVPLSRLKFSHCFAAAALFASPTVAQEIVSPPVEAAGVSPEAAPAPVENAAGSSSTEAQPLEINPIVDPVAPRPSNGVNAGVNSGRDLPAPAPPLSRLFAAQISVNAGIISAQGTSENPVRLETSAGNLSALQIQLDTQKQEVEATGQVRLEREIITERRELRSRARPKTRYQEKARETLVGQNLRFNFKTRSGTLDSATIQLASLSISTDSLAINGQRYSTKNVILRPGALSEAERKIYGTPPFSIRAKSLEATVGGAPGTENVRVKGGGLYFKNTRILPIPTYVFQAGLRSGEDTSSNFSLTPDISFNSADRILLETRFAYALSATQPEKLFSFVDVGFSQRVGFRGGIGVESNLDVGRFVLRSQRSDVVETQLTNRIELDRKAELLYDSPAFATFPLPGGRRAGFTLGGSYGSYAERTIGQNSGEIDASRAQARLLFTTRLNSVDGPFLRLFATATRYGGMASHYNSRGFEVGYDGQLLPRVRGQISYRSASLSGQTPFRFDEIEIRRELRSTIDLQLSPRYLLPIDLRYDVSRRTFRDKSYGLLRSYKTFAYGVVYQTARRDLRLEVRQGF